MKNTAILVISITLLMSCANNKSSGQTAEEVRCLAGNFTDNSEELDKPKIEAVFVLDATGSMAGLIHTAKEKIWSVALSMSQAEPTPELKIGMVFYRDRGDDFVTKILPLTEEIDFIYSDLIEIQASGGGDTPESVNQALAEAIGSINWNNDDDVYRVVFLVGDCPPHMNYRNDQKYPVTCDKANAHGITINTIQLGNCRGAEKIWKEIAAATNGTYLHLAQDAEGLNITTPFDEEINNVYRKIEGTKLIYGTDRVKQKEQSKAELSDKFSSEASVAANTRRALYNSSKIGKKNLYGGADLVDRMETDSVFSVSDVTESELPEAMKDMSEAEREKFASEKLKERQELNKKLTVLAIKREEYIQTELEKAGNSEDNFSQQVFTIIQEQAEDKGIVIEGKAKH